MLPALLSVAEADRILAGFSSSADASPGVSWPTETVALEDAFGRILREDLTADRAYPAQDRSRMDGIAVAYNGQPLPATLLEEGFPVAGLARAGEPRRAAPPTGSCVEIMTGAALPIACDTVIPYEEVDIADGVARLRAGANVRPGQFVHVAGSDCAPGAVLVPAGVRLQAAQIAVAASVGKPHLLVARRPRIAIVATGDELVAVDQQPLDHQLRVSNAHGLAALLAPWAETRVHRIADEPAALTALLRAVLSTFDLVLVSGGVSAGKFDLVPDTLESLGVQKVFHKVAQKPGKPLWFGTLQTASVTPPHKPAGSAAPTFPNVFVFGLPGNPVSALMCARRFVLPFVWRTLGWTEPPRPSWPLAVAVDSPSRLTQYLPVRLETKAVSETESGEASEFETVAETVVNPRPVNGSGDFATLGASDGFLELPPGQNHYPAGARMAFFPWST